MKKALGIITLGLMGLFIIASCKKDPKPVEPKTTIVFGDTIDMQVFHFSEDDVQYHSAPNNYYWHYSIDIDEDQEEDLCFRWEDVGSPGIGRDVISTVLCTNDHVALSGELYDYNIYYNESVSEYIAGDGLYVVESLYKLSCQPITDSDSIVETHEQLNLYDKSEGESIDLTDSYFTMNVRLRNRNYEWGDANFVGDTVFAFRHLESYKECDYFPQDEVRYIGFKYTDNGNDKLGWVKFILGSDGIFTVLESAIQK